jgi:hypothetical protein
MSAAEIIEILEVSGIKITCEGNQLRVRSNTAKITNEQKKLISDSKSKLIAFLNGSANERNSGSLEPELTKATPLPSSEQEPSPNPSREPFFKEYKLPNGEILQLTKEEFYRVVDVFRMLWEEDKRKNRTKKGDVA